MCLYPLSLFSLYVYRVENWSKTLFLHVQNRYIRIMNYLEWRITAWIDRRIATSRITQIDTYEYITHEKLTSRAYRVIW